jgi:hypothetical protein
LAAKTGQECDLSGNPLSTADALACGFFGMRKRFLAGLVSLKVLLRQVIPREPTFLGKD